MPHTALLGIETEHRARSQPTALPGVPSERHRGRQLQRACRGQAGCRKESLQLMRRFLRPGGQTQPHASSGSRFSISERKSCALSYEHSPDIPLDRGRKIPEQVLISASTHSRREPPPSRAAAGCTLNVCMPPPAGGHCHCAHQDSCHSGWARLFTQAYPPREQPRRFGGQILGSPGPHLPSMWTAANSDYLLRMMS